MIDGWAKRKIDPYLDRIARILAGAGVSPNAITLIGCALGLAAAGTIWFGHFVLALFLVIASRVADGLDGSVARISGKSDFGGYLDIVLDFVFYGAIPLGFILLDPHANGIAGAVLIFSFYVNGASFLAFAILAEKRNLSSAVRGEKSLYFTTGLAEATETYLVFVLAILFPNWFPALAMIFAVICFYTAAARILLARSSFPG